MCGLIPRGLSPRSLPVCRQHRHRYVALESKTSLDMALPQSQSHPQTYMHPRPRPLRTAPQQQPRSSLPRALRFGCRRSRSPSAELVVPASGAFSSRASNQHQRLLLELLPFQDRAAFEAWIGSDAVAGAWREFAHDYHPSAEDIDDGPEQNKAGIAQAACRALQIHDPRYMLHHPRKEGWAPEDHYIRFIVAVICDSMLHGVWSESEGRSRGLEIAKSVFEVLSYLRVTNWDTGDCRTLAMPEASTPRQDPPSYDEVTSQ